MEWLTEPLEHAFMRQALAASVLVGATCSLLGVYVVLRRMAFLGEAIAHTTMPGLVISYLNQWNLLVGAVVSALLAAVGIGWLSRRQRLREDTAIGVVFTGMFALGIVLITRTKSYRDFSHLLFGNVLGVSNSDLIGIVVVFVIVVTVLTLINKELMLTTVDSHHAQTIGVSAERLRYVLLILMALAVVTGIQAVGVILTTALIVTPAATASILTRRLKWMFAWAIAFSSLSSIGGLYASYHWDVSSGGAIVLACSGFFVIVFVGERLLSHFAS